MRSALLPLVAVLASAPSSASSSWRRGAAGDELEWDAAAVEHLWNRAGFGARPEEIARGVALGPEALVEELLRPVDERREDPPFVQSLVPDRRRMRLLDARERRELIDELKDKNREQQRSYLAGWIESMLEGRSPLLDRMTLFWHGLFTSQISKVQFSSEMIEQDLLLRRHALGNYGELLRAILRDPAMLVYLDNDQSDAEHPNENLARELLELFSLGEGHYTEADVQDTARALTGHGVERGHGYRFDPTRHDHGPKTVLGVSGPLDLDDVVDAILEQPQCARHVAGRLIGYLEGVAPSPARLERYAALLREGDYEVEPLLRALLLDPEFYRPEVVGARVLSPLDYAVGTCRRLGVQPPAAALGVGAALLGEELFEPPNVKGWEGGDAWITTGSLMDRGNLAGLFLGVVSLDDLVREDRLAEEPGPDGPALAEDGEIDQELDRVEDDESMDSMSMMSLEMMAREEPGAPEGRGRTPRSPLLRVVRVLETVGYAPRIHLRARLEQRGVASDGEVVDAMLDELLAIEAPRDTRRALVLELRRMREEAGIGKKELLEAGERAERILRRLAHLVLSLPEAQLG